MKWFCTIIKPGWYPWPTCWPSDSYSPWQVRAQAGITFHPHLTQMDVDAVEVNGKTLAMGHSDVTASGLTVTYANTTVEDGSLWVHPGPFTLPTVSMTTER